MTWTGSHAEYNIRQMRLAKRALGEYLGSARSLVDLGRLVATLDALEAAMESPDERWLPRFHEQVLGLETVYAFASIA